MQATYGFCHIFLDFFFSFKFLVGTVFCSLRGQQDFKREMTSRHGYNLCDVLNLYNNYIENFLFYLYTAQDKRYNFWSWGTGDMEREILIRE